MTSAQNANLIRETRENLISFLRKMKKSEEAGHLIADFCLQTKTDRSLAELALSSLLNRGEVTPNRDMKLEAKAEAEAA
ncbi:hypothetical protein [Roseibium polysiphoniae]|nr:hypothetical protein [Roseibium polysiphoniae]